MKITVWKAFENKQSVYHEFGPLTSGKSIFWLSKQYDLIENFFMIVLICGSPKLDKKRRFYEENMKLGFYVQNRKFSAS